MALMAIRSIPKRDAAGRFQAMPKQPKERDAAVLVRIPLLNGKHPKKSTKARIDPGNPYKEVLEVLVGCQLVDHWNFIKDGSLRVATLFKYPDSLSIDVFVRPYEGAYAGNWSVSDGGQTADYLMELGVRMLRYPRVLEPVCESLKLRLEDAQFTASVYATDVPYAIRRVVQACIRAGELHHKAR